MKTIKRILIVLLVLVVLLVGFLLAAPVLFKDQIVANVKQSINESVTAEVDFADVDVSFLRSFPDISVRLEDYSVIGVDTFAGLPLARGESATVGLGFWSVVAGDGNYRIEDVRLVKPDLNLRVLSPELANYLIVPESGGGDAGAAPEEATATLTLEHFAIEDGHLIYDDRTTATYLEMNGLDVEGNGDFAATVFDLGLDAEADALTLRQAGVGYLSRAHATLGGLINVDLDNSKYTFRNNRARINELDLDLNGSIDLEDNDDIVFDLTYAAPANDFRQLWSMIPAVYTEGYQQIQAGGTFTLGGSVRGPYNGEREVYPAFTLQSEIAAGSVQYPGRPVGVRDIDAKVSVVSPGADLDQLTVDIPRFDFVLGGDPFRGRFALRRPISDPTVDARIDGTLDLRKWAEAVPLEGVRELAGVIVADVTLDGVRQSVLDAGDYAAAKVAGDLRISNLVYDSEDYPPVRIARATAEFTPRALNLEGITATLGRSDVDLSGRIDNFLAYFSPEQTMRGSLRLRSNFFDADEWITEEASTDRALSPAELSTPAPAAAATTDPSADASVFDRFDFDVDAEIARLNYGTYRPKNLRAIGNVKPNELALATASVDLGESNLAANGSVSNLFDYTFGAGVLTGKLNLRAGYLNLADFMDEEVAVAAPTGGSAPASPPPAAESAVIPIPRNIKLNLDVLADRVQYTDVQINDLRGNLLVTDGEAVFENGSGRLLGGTMNFAGAYDTAEPGEPGFRFQYDLRSLNFGQAFSVLNTFAALAPVGKYIDGLFNSEMIVEGKLGPDLFPRLSTVNATGLFNTSQATISGFKPLSVVGNALNVNALKHSTTLRDIRAAFAITDGRVTVKPFDLRVAGLPMTVGGTHGLDTDMDYQIRAAVPREMIAGNIVTGSALNALDRLAGQAGKLGFNIAPGDTLNLNLKLTGSLLSPKVGVDLLGRSGGGGGGSVTDQVVAGVQEEVRQQIDDRKQEVEDRIAAERAKVEQQGQALRADAEARARALEDSLRRAAATEAERLKRDATDRIGNALGLGRDTTRRDSLPPTNVPTVDDVKRELERFNPFNRKKSGGTPP